MQIDLDFQTVPTPNAFHSSLPPSSSRQPTVPISSLTTTNAPLSAPTTSLTFALSAPSTTASSAPAISPAPPGRTTTINSLYPPHLPNHTNSSPPHILSNLMRKSIRSTNLRILKGIDENLASKLNEIPNLVSVKGNFFENLVSSLTSFSHAYKHFIKTGDLNCNLCRDSYESNNLKELVFSLRLSLVEFDATFHTTTFDSRLDVIIIDTNSNLISSSKSESPFIAGNDILEISYALDYPIQQYRFITRRSVSHFSDSDFLNCFFHSHDIIPY